MEDPARAKLARRVREVTIRVEDTLKVLLSDIPGALLRSKLMAAMEIDVIAPTELLEQVGGDPTRIDIAESFIRRRSHAVEDRARRERAARAT